jgi:hypothetical protein
MKDGFARPLVITKDTPELSIPIARNCERFYLLGNVTLPSGYPLEGKMGATAATIEIRYQDGRLERCLSEMVTRSPVRIW